jgi:hypothetical protein
MNMLDSKEMKMNRITYLLVLILAFSSCRKEEPIYEVNGLPLDLVETSKTKLKSPNQFIAVLYANLFQTALSPNDLVEINFLIDAIGDDQVAYEVIISNFMNKSNVILPTDSAMRQDPVAFIENTYERFLIRRPTEAEKTWFKNQIETDNNITAELVYFAFTLSEEYQYY